LNRIKVYLAANISNPLVAPWLIFAEIQIGAWLRRGSAHPLSRSTLESTGLWTFAVDLLVGSVVLGALLGALAAWATAATMRQTRVDDAFRRLARRAADRYAGASMTAWEFARGKLRFDPIYLATIGDGLLPPSGGTLVDVGCGQGVTLALLAEVRRDADLAAQLPTPPPRFQRLIGIELRGRVAALARTALGADAEIVTGDIRECGARRADAVLLFDVLQMLRPSEQEQVIAALAAALAPGGVMLVREVDAAAGWRFTAVIVGNRLKALAAGHLRQRFYARSATDWHACFARHGLDASVTPMGRGTPFGNVLLRVTQRT
jgi:SAM-dependent methyltransferase